MFYRHGVQFIVAIFLVRMLTPAEFGTMALLSLFLGFGFAFADSGFSAALIQRQENTHVDESTVFWINMMVSLFAALLLWLSAPSIAAFFNVDVIQPVARVLAFCLPIGTSASVHQALLTKRLEFRTLLLVGLFSVSCSSFVAIVLAWKGYGVWALTAQIMCGSTLSAIALWILSPWRPALIFSLSSARRMFSFGGYILAASMLGIIYGRLYSVLIGKFYSLSDLGFYSRAENTKQLPITVLSDLLFRVAQPVFSEAASDTERLKRGVSMALRSSMLITAPTMLGLAAVAKPFVVTLFGNQWLSIVPILQVLCLSGILGLSAGITITGVIAQGHSKFFFGAVVIKQVIGIILIIAGSLYGVMGIAWSQVAVSIVSFLISAHVSKLCLGY